MNFQQVDELIKMPFEKKIDYSQTIIEKQITPDTSVVAFSGGKQSLVLLHLILQYNPTVKAVYNNTGVEYPEVPEFVNQLKEEWHLDIEVLKPEVTFWDCLRRYGWPKPRLRKEKEVRKGTGTPRCCYHLKDKPMRLFMKAERRLDRVFLGLTASESRSRKFLFVTHGTCYVTTKNYGFPVMKVNPLMPWTDEDTWRYIKENRLPYCSAYEKYGVPRLGCWTCTAFLDWEKQMQRFSPKFYAWVLKDMIQRGDPRGHMVLEHFEGELLPLRCQVKR